MIEISVWAGVIIGGLGALFTALSWLNGRNSLDFQKSAIPVITVKDFKGYALGARPSAKIVVSNVSTNSPMTITTSYETDLVSPGNKPQIWGQYKENSTPGVVDRQRITLAPGHSSELNVFWARALGAKEIQDLTKLRRALRLAAIVEYIDATGKSKKAYHCIHWHGPIDSFKAYTCETPRI